MLAPDSRRMRSVVMAAVLSWIAVAGAGRFANAQVEGRAEGAWINVPSRGVVDRTICDTGWLPPDGGAQYDFSSSTELPGVIKFYAMSTSSHSDKCKGESRSRSRSLVLLPGDVNEIVVDGFTASRRDTCCKPEDDDDLMGVVFGAITIGGQPVSVTGLPDQIVEIPGVGTLVVNEHHRGGDHDCDPDDDSINALHLYLANSEEIVVGTAHLDHKKECCVVPTQSQTWGRLKQSYR